MLEEVNFRAHHGKLFAYTSDWVLIGQVSSIDNGVHIKLMGKKFRGGVTVVPVDLAVGSVVTEIPLKGDPE